MASKVEIPEREVLEELLPYLTTELQKTATKAGWPSGVISHLSVEAGKGNLEISFPSYLEEQINSLEYGTGTMPPRSVFRPFVSRYGSQAANRLSDTVLNMFMDGEL